MATYTIDTTLRSQGTDHHVYYYPDGYGSTYEGYVTSLTQYKRELRKHLTSSEVKLYTISSSGSSMSIDYEQDLRKAVANLPDGGELAVIAVKDNTVHPELGPDPIGPYPEDVEDVMRRFDVPAHTYCYHDCGRLTSGLRYFWHRDNDYVLCPDCYDNLSWSDRGNWKRGNDGGAPWERDAPEATLEQDAGSPVLDEVRHLQYLLTRLGFLSLSDTDSLVGGYRTNTARGVKLFRVDISTFTMGIWKCTILKPRRK